MKKEEYLKYVEETTKRADVKKTFLFSFLFGGLICSFGEALRFLFLNFSLNEKDASACVSFVLIMITAILTGLGLFHKIAKIAGAGTFVPITGFANSVISSALEFKTEGFILGVGAKIFVIAGPVIVYGTLASVICGLVFYFIGLLGGTI